MTKGAILIGAGFTPTDEDVDAARIAGYIQNANATSRVYSAKVGKEKNAVEQITSSFILEQYARRLELNEWELPGSLQVFRLVIQEGCEMLSVCPTSAVPTQNSLPSREELDTILAQALTNPLQTFPILHSKKIGDANQDGTGKKPIQSVPEEKIKASKMVSKPQVSPTTSELIIATDKVSTVPVVKVRCGLQTSPTYYYFKISSLETIHDEIGICPNCGKNVTLQVVPGRKVAPQETWSALYKLIKAIVINLGGASLFIVFLYLFSVIVVRNTIPALTSIISFLIAAFGWLPLVPFGLAIGAVGFALLRITDTVRKDGLLNQILLRHVPDRGKIFSSFGHKVDEIEPFVKWVHQVPEYHKTITLHCKNGSVSGPANSSGNTAVFTFTLGGPSIERVEERICPCCKDRIFLKLHSNVTILDVNQVNLQSRASMHTLEL